MNKALCLVYLLAVLMATASAEAANIACFDWTCDPSTGVCTFDASCTQLTQGSLWRYSWEWGDGSGDLTGNNVIVHSYGSSGCFYPNVQLTVIPFGADSFSALCQIAFRDCVGPPLGTGGRCQ